MMKKGFLWGFGRWERVYVKSGEIMVEVSLRRDRRSPMREEG